MTVRQMRDAIADVYPNNTWKYKVNAMPDCQVIAVYYKFKETGKFDKPVDRNGKVMSKRELRKYTGVQLTFNFDDLT